MKNLSKNLNIKNLNNNNNNKKLNNLYKSFSNNTAQPKINWFNKMISKYIEPYEAPHPKVVSYPGPKSFQTKQYMKTILGNYKEVREVIDIEKSFGNYFTDVDNNTILDMHMDNGKNILGYNHRTLVKDAYLEKFERFVVHRPAIGAIPPIEYPQLVDQFLRKISPNHDYEVYFTCGCESSANENALKFASLKKFFDLKGTDTFTTEEESSVMLNKAPGVPNFSFIGFEGANHGKLMGSLTLSYKTEGVFDGVASFGWPVLPYPDIKYPLESNVAHNMSEEAKVLELVEKKITELESVQPVCGVIIEPIQTRLGIKYASARFFDGLMEVCERKNIPFILDETKSSGWVSGKNFLHETWGLDRVPDIVTFGGRTQSSGLFYKQSFKPKYPGLVFSTWNGDIFKLEKIIKVHDYMQNLGWNEEAAKGFIIDIDEDFLEMQSKSSVRLSNFRGIGKVFGFDVPSNTIRNEVVMLARRKGFKVNPIGDLTVGFTPSIIFEEFHFQHFKKFMIECEPRSVHSENI